MYIIQIVAAARPNFMKIAPLYHAIKDENWANVKIVHTGQHYDLNMSDVFFKDLELPEPHLHLNIGSGSHAEQTGKVLIEYEKVLYEQMPDLVVVVGDVNSTLACSLAAAKTHFRVVEYGSSFKQKNKRPAIVHLEAGLRSFDFTMPEEINRILTDRISDVLLTPSIDADKNLLNEGIDKKKIVRVGNIMIDSFEFMREKIEKKHTYQQYGLTPNNYAVVTLHRPSNVDNKNKLEAICNSLSLISEKLPILFPVHPRTKNKLLEFSLSELLEQPPQIIMIEPLGYKEFMNTVLNSKVVITDSGGVQEETTYMNIPCITLRNNTERPITVNQGSNILCRVGKLYSYVSNVLNGQAKKSSIPEMWDGNTALRVKKYLYNYLSA
jgi:UDP-N-acetylglucosamine 2-epimerase (non-hydrolysing)